MGRCQGSWVLVREFGCVLYFGCFDLLRGGGLGFEGARSREYGRKGGGYSHLVGNSDSDCCTSNYYTTTLAMSSYERVAQDDEENIGLIPAKPQSVVALFHRRRDTSKFRMAGSHIYVPSKLYLSLSGVLYVLDTIL